MYAVNQINDRYKITKDQTKDFSVVQFYSFGDQLYILAKETENVGELNRDRIYLYKLIVSGI